MNIATTGGAEFGEDGGATLRRQKFLESIVAGLPKAGPLGQGSGSPAERKNAVAETFLRIMLEGRPATASMLKDHPAYLSNGMNYIGHRCKQIGLQWYTAAGKKHYPASGANMLKICLYLVEHAPESLERLASSAGMTVDEVVSIAEASFKEGSAERPDETMDIAGSNLAHETSEPRDDFVDVPEDFSLNNAGDYESLGSQMNAMLENVLPSEAAVIDKQGPMHGGNAALPYGPSDWEAPANSLAHQTPAHTPE